MCPLSRNTLLFLPMFGEFVMPAMGGHVVAPMDLIVTRFEQLQRTRGSLQETANCPAFCGYTLHPGGGCLRTESRWLYDLENFLCLLHSAGQVSY
jgi:hypothetical protein